MLSCLHVQDLGKILGAHDPGLMLRFLAPNIAPQGTCAGLPSLLEPSTRVDTDARKTALGTAFALLQSCMPKPT